MNIWPKTAFQVAAITLALTACSNEYATRAEPVTNASIAADNATLTLGFLGGTCDHDSEVTITETTTALKVDLQVRARSKESCAHTFQGVPYGVTVKLRSPLGGRELWTSKGQQISLTPQERLNPLPARKVTFVKQ